MPDEKIADLIERVERASGSDREIDRAVHAYVCEHILRWQWKDVGPDYDGKNASRILAPPDMPKGFAYPLTGAIHPWYHVPDSPITGSLDAVLSLVERVRPDYDVEIYVDRNAGGGSVVNLWRDSGEKLVGMFIEHDATAKTAPLAVLSALLRSIQG